MSLAAQRKYHLVEAGETAQEPLEDQTEALAPAYAPEFELMSGDALDTCSAVGAGITAVGRPTRIMVHRSLSPDGLINLVSVTIDLSIDGLTIQEIKAKGMKALRLETEIVQGYMESLSTAAPPGKAEPEINTNGADDERFAAPARLLNISKAKGNTYFINVKVGGKRAKLFGTPRQLVTHLASISQELTPEAISDGLQLDYACRAITELNGNGRYLNVVKLLPAA
jgi:hypothetical protein